MLEIVDIKMEISMVKKWVSLESAMFWTTWIIDGIIYIQPRTKIPRPVTMGRLVKPRSYIFLYQQKQPSQQEDARDLTSTSISQAISHLDDSNSEEAYSDPDLWKPRGLIIYLKKTKIPSPMTLGRLVMPRRYRMTFPWNDDWSYAL
ncbi:uncharacterized protein LOC117188963 [Drosophila miranda]|uniref:uncharacterized protein LOC117188963 n=1 Tax=Drosophila miranda TaxID=7229 RepID=UPI00143F2855|nr:uncharacterized protein LOC117188963 [Drosophila miranda]